jgi:hypothetical protein
LRKITYGLLFLTYFSCTLQASGLNGNHGNSSESRPYYFYHALSYGTQAIYNPMNVIINGGYGILQIPQSISTMYGRKIFDYPYQEWGRNVWQTVGHPIGTINEFGWGRFITTELFPLTLNMQGNQWVPNYFLHVIGGGLHFRATEEWFHYHGFSAPRMWSIATMVLYHALSEVVENHGEEDLTVDHLADLLIFDPVGMVLFANDGVCRFFSEKLNLAEWSMQPAINFANGNLENMGQFYVVKYPVTGSKKWNLMIHFGLHGMAGFAHQWSEGRSLSLTGGFLVEDLVEIEPGGGERTLQGVLTWRAGIFYDLNNSLLASLMVSNVAENRVRLNVYPGVLRLGPISPGLFVSGSKEWVVGMYISFMPIGGAWGW